MANKPKILFTSSLSDAQIQFAESNGIDLKIVHLISTNAIVDIPILEQLKSLTEKNILAIFTSQSSLNILSPFFAGHIPRWKIACTTPLTFEQASNIFGGENIIATGKSAFELAQELIQKQLDFDQIVFFSGMDRKNDLPEIMYKRYPEKWKEIKLYTTDHHTFILEEYYDGIAFCSPSAVDALFDHNTMNLSTKYFAIGSTTARSLKERGIEQIIVSEIPDKSKMLAEIVNTFN